MSPAVRMRAVQACLLAAILGIAAGGPAAAQSAFKVAVIDVNRIMTDSQRGKAVLEAIDKMQAERSTQLKTLNEELVEMQKRFQEGRLSLAEDKLAQLQAQIEDRTRNFQRAREDAERDVQKQRADEIEKVEAAVFPIINTLGKEGGYTLIFNKFQSGLVYADETIDITALVIQRLDAGASGSSGNE